MVKKIIEEDERERKQQGAEVCFLQTTGKTVKRDIQQDEPRRREMGGGNNETDGKFVEA